MKVELSPEEWVLYKLYELMERLKEKKLFMESIEVLEVYAVVEKMVEELRSLRARTLQRRLVLSTSLQVAPSTVHH